MHKGSTTREYSWLGSDAHSNGDVGLHATSGCVATGLRGQGRAPGGAGRMVSPCMLTMRFRSMHRPNGRTPAFPNIEGWQPPSRRINPVLGDGVLTLPFLGASSPRPTTRILVLASSAPGGRSPRGVMTPLFHPWPPPAGSVSPHPERSPSRRSVMPATWPS